MINLTDLLLGINPNITWNRRIPNALKSLAKWEHKLSQLSGEKVSHFKKGKDFMVDKRKVPFVLESIANHEKDEVLSLKLRLKSQQIENENLLDQIAMDTQKRNEVESAVQLKGWDDYNREVLERLKKNPALHRDTINEYWLTVSNYTTISTVRMRLTSMRKLIGDDDNLLNEFRLPTALNDFIVRKGEEKKKRNINSVTKQVIKISDIKKMITSNLNDLSTIGNPKEYKLPERSRIVSKALATVVMITGRRSIEALKTGEFTPVKDKPNFINFTGQAKIQDKDRANEFNIEIPLLFATSDQVIQVISIIRNFLGKSVLSKNNSLVTKYTSSATANYWIENVVKFKIDVKDKNHGLRALYAVTCEKMFNQSQTNQVAQSVYFGNLLGHLEYGDQTWEHYFSYTVDAKGFNLKAYLSNFRKENNVRD